MTLSSSYHASTDEGRADERWAVIEDPALAAGFTQVPNSIMRSPGLSLQAKCIYGLLLSYAWQDPESYPGLNRLRGDTGAKIDTIRKYINELVDAGLIEVRRRGLGRTNRYIFRSLDRRPGGSANQASRGYHPPGGGIQIPPGGGNQEYPERAVTDTPQRGVSGLPSEGGTTNTQRYADAGYPDSEEKDSPEDDDDDAGTRAENHHVHVIRSGLISASLPRLLSVVGAKRAEEYADMDATDAARWMKHLSVDESSSDSLAQIAARIRATHGQTGIDAAEEALRRCGTEYRSGAVSNLDAYLARAVPAALVQAGNRAADVATANDHADGAKTMSQPATTGSGLPSGETRLEAANANSARAKQTAKSYRKEAREFREALKDDPEIDQALSILHEIDGFPTGLREDQRTVQSLTKYREEFPEVHPPELCRMYAAWAADKPLRSNSRPRAALRTWFQKDPQYGGKASRQAVLAREREAENSTYTRAIPSRRQNERGMVVGPSSTRPASERIRDIE